MTTRLVVYLAVVAALGGCGDSHAPGDATAGTRRFRGHYDHGWEWEFIRECGSTEWWVIGWDPDDPSGGSGLYGAHNDLRLPRGVSSYVDVVATISEEGIYGPPSSTGPYRHEVIVRQVLDIRAPSDTDCRVAGDAGPVAPYDAGPGEPPSGCNPAGACCNRSDIAAITALYGVAMDTDYSDVATVCAQGCVLEGDFATCTAACLGMATMDAASDPCEACFTAVAVCFVENCTAECAADRSSPACVACLCGANAAMESCIDDAAICTGFPTTRCD